MKKAPISLGDYEYKDASVIDNIAYRLYMKHENEKRKGDNSWVYYNQTGFIGSVDCEKYYEQANIILRNKKLSKIKDGI